MRGSIPPVLAERSVRCILFDLGGTIWYRNKRDWSHLETLANRSAGEQLRTLPSPGSFSHKDEEARGHQLRQALHEEFREQVRQAPHLEPDGPQLVQQALRSQDIRVDSRTSQELFEALRIPIEMSRILFEDSLPTLKALQERGFQLGVVTNRLWGGRPFVEGLAAFDLLNCFDPQKMAISADLGLRKPTPDIFWHALRAHGVAPDETVMVGNSLPADVVGPQSLGMLATWKPKPMEAVMVKEHFARYGTSLEWYNAGHIPPGEVRPDQLPAESLPSGMFDTTLADILHHSDYWYKFLRGRIRPDCIIEQMSDLLDVFLLAGKQP